MFGKYLASRTVAPNGCSGLINLSKIKGKCLLNTETLAMDEETSRR